MMMRKYALMTVLTSVVIISVSPLTGMAAGADQLPAAPAAAQAKLPVNLGTTVAGNRLRDVLIGLSPQGRQVFIEALKDERADRADQRRAAEAAQARIMAAMIEMKRRILPPENADRIESGAVRWFKT